MRELIIDLVGAIIGCVMIVPENFILTNCLNEFISRIMEYIVPFLSEK
jgi:hypothetical protein